MSYFLKSILSPILNIALDTFDKKQSKLLLILLTIICIYFGWYWQDAVNIDGYNLINFIWIYCIGYYLKHYFDHRSIAPIAYIIIWIVCSVINSVFSIIFSTYHAWAYNNPLVVISAIAFFLFFVSFDFSSKIVNNIARCTLGVYLIHENAYMSQYIYSEKIASIYSSNIIYFIGSVLLLFSACSIVDWIIRKVLVQPIVRFVSNIHKNN